MHRTIKKSLASLVCSIGLLAGCGGGNNNAPKALVVPGTDATPDQFIFVDQQGVDTGVEITSAPVVITGIDTAAPVSVTNGTYSIDGGAFTDVAGTLNSGASVQVRHTSSATAGGSVTTTLQVDSVSDLFTSTTTAPAGADYTPDAFTFTPATAVAVSTVVTSDPTIISGMDAGTPVSVVNGMYSVDGGLTFTSADGTLNPGDSVILSHTSAATASTDTVTTLIVGTVSGTFTSTTAP